MRKLTTLLLAGALGLGFGARALADDEPVNRADLPTAVQKTLDREAKGGTVEELTKETDEAGTVTYEAEIMKNGKETDLEMSDQGKVLERGKAHEEKGEKGEHGNQQQMEQPKE